LEKSPAEFSDPRQGWTARSLRSVLEHHSNINYNLRTIYSLIKKCGYGLITPRKRHYEANPKKQKEWSETTGEDLLTHPEHLAIEDETTVQVATTVKKVIAKKGTKPYIQIKVGRYDIRWNVYITYWVQQQKVIVDLRQGLDAQTFKTHLMHVKREWGKGRINYVIDGSGSHKEQTMKASCSKKGIHFYYFPPHSPMMNPVEEINRQLKRELANQVFNSLNDLKTSINQFFENHQYHFTLNVSKYFHNLIPTPRTKQEIKRKSKKITIRSK